MLLLINNLHEKSITGGQDRRNFDVTPAICSLLLFYNFTFMLHKKCKFVFIQSDMCIFFMYIINPV